MTQSQNKESELMRSLRVDAKMMRTLRFAAADEIELLRISLSEAEKDTERLRWLLDDYRRVDLYNAIGTMDYPDTPERFNDLRAAIDATMKAKAPK